MAYWLSYPSVKSSCATRAPCIINYCVLCQSISLLGAKVMITLSSIQLFWYGDDIVFTISQMWGCYYTSLGINFKLRLALDFPDLHHEQSFQMRQWLSHVCIHCLGVANRILPALSSMSKSKSYCCVKNWRLMLRRNTVFLWEELDLTALWDDALSTSWDMFYSFCTEVEVQAHYWGTTFPQLSIRIFF